MKSFTWGSQFETGLTDIDKQHEALVSMVNEFGSIIADDKLDYDFIKTTFNNLAEYAQNHFTAEEELMREANLDSRHIDLHLRQHFDFVSEVTTLFTEVTPEGNNTSNILFEYLLHWLVYHILGSDQKMARQIDSVASGLTPKEAFEKEEFNARNDQSEPLFVALNGLFAIASKRNEELLELNRSLEKRVEERTQELLIANKNLEKLSTTDHLTQLPNRRFAMNQFSLLLDESTKFQSPISCIMIDADGFKEINDQYGHDAGDIVLISLSKTLLHSTRSDDIVCRLGGDEFIILCPNTDLKGATQIGETLRGIVAKMKVQAGDGFWYGSISVGCGCSASGITTSDMLIKAADDALYSAKETGKNCVRGKEIS